MTTDRTIRSSYRMPEKTFWGFKRAAVDRRMSQEQALIEAVEQWVKHPKISVPKTGKNKGLTSDEVPLTLLAVIEKVFHSAVPDAIDHLVGAALLTYSLSGGDLNDEIAQAARNYQTSTQKQVTEVKPKDSAEGTGGEPS